MNNTFIKLGKITEEQLVEKFATESQKKEYHKNEDKMTGSLKTRILKRASHYCKINDLGKGSYDIRYVYDYPMPSNINKMQKDIYKDLIPLILSKLLSSDKHYNFTIEVWARELNMINQNYSIIKNNKFEASKILKVECSSIEDFYIHVSQSVEYYILTSFRYLKDAGCIDFNKTVLGMYEFIQPNIVNEDMCNYLLKKIFGDLLYKTRSNRLTSCFTNLLIDNAKKRTKNSEEYKKLFEYMCDITISTKPNKSITSKLNNLKSNIEANEKL